MVGGGGVSAAPFGFVVLTASVFMLFACAKYRELAAVGRSKFSVCCGGGICTARPPGNEPGELLLLHSAIYSVVVSRCKIATYSRT